MAANKPLEISLFNYFAVEKKFPKKVDTRYATKRSNIHLAATRTTVAEICASLNLMVYQATAASIRLPRTEVTDLSLAAPDEEISNSTTTNQESLLSRPVKTKLGFAPRQQDPRVCPLKTKSASPQKR